ncbi:MAG: hypothetical protein ABI591_15380, partial [Kofleriaceae bacterium]
MTQARTGIREVLRLTGLLLAVALATSRFGLLGHELVGHGGTALVVGGRVTDVQLFWFAGGWIRYQFASPPGVAALLAIAMGGVAIEALCGVALWTLVRGATLGRRLVRAIGATFVVHATWYFATGAWHGYGDGQLLYRELGSARFPVAIAAGVITCVCGFLAARQIVGPLVATASRPWLVVVAAVLAGGLHAGLAVGEVRLRRDTTYADVMQPERERAVDRDLERWAAYESTHGGKVTDARRAAEHARLERVHHTFPFVWLLAVCAVLSILAGAWRSLARSNERLAI